MYCNICIYNTHSWNYCQIFLKIGVSLDPTMWWICKKGRFQAGYYIYIYIYINIRILYGCSRWTIPKKWDTQWLDTYRMAHIQMIIGSDLGMWSFTHFGWSHATYCIVTQPSTLHVMNDANRRRPILLQGTTWVTSLLKILTSGDGSKPWYLVNPKS